MEFLLGRIFKINHGGTKRLWKQTLRLFYSFLTVLMLTKAIGADSSVKRGLKPLLLSRVMQAVSRYWTHFSFESADPARASTALEGFRNQYVIGYSVVDNA